MRQPYQEPNLSIHKNALPALVILNYYFINYPSRINAIHLLSKPKHDNYLESISHFEIYKANKIISYPRIVSLDFFITPEGFSSYVAMSQKIPSLVFYTSDLILLGIHDKWRNSSVFIDVVRHDILSKAYRYLMRLIL